MKTQISLVLVTTFFILLFSLNSYKFKPAVLANILNENVSVMVKFKDQLDESFLDEIKLYPSLERRKILYKTLTNLALKTQSDVVDFLEQKKLPYKRHYLINAIYLHLVDKDTVSKLSKFSEIENIFLVPNFYQTKTLTAQRNIEPKNRQANLVEPNISHIGADRVWEEFTDGSGIVVASQDTGAYWSHGALINQYRGSVDGKVVHDYNWHDAVKQSLTSYQGDNPCGFDSPVPCDDLSHGTHVLGIAVGGDSTNSIGVAPGASWIACRNKDKGVGNVSTYIGCFEFFLAPYKIGGDAMRDGDPTKAPHIISNSWSCPESEGCVEDQFSSLLKILKSAGIFVVVSAGNSGPRCSSVDVAPALNTEDAFSVGTIFYETNQIWHLSSRGPSPFNGKVVPHIVAPGINIRSSISDGQFGNDWYGSSMATPHVAGAVALIWASNKNLIGKVDETAKILMDTATGKFAQIVCGDNKNNIPNNTYGHGILDVYEAVKQANSLSQY